MHVVIKAQQQVEIGLQLYIATQLVSLTCSVKSVDT